MSDTPRVAVAGATGRLGGLIVAALRRRGVAVSALVRPRVARAKLEPLQAAGAEVRAVDHTNVVSVAEACEGVSCVVSALAGLRDVIVDTQTVLLDGAVAAGVPRFIPSDFALDLYRIPPGSNRNLDDRRAFAGRLERAPIAPTSVLNGMFTDLLVGPAPVVLFRLRRVAYWKSADQPLDFTTIEDAADYTADAALDAAAPRFLRIAGHTVTARGLAAIASEVTGERFTVVRAGGLRRLGALIRFTQLVAPGRDETYPPWQGMQYLRNMFSGDGRLTPLDNDRYGPRAWTSVGEVLAAR